MTTQSAANQDRRFAGLVEFSPGFRPRPEISHVLFDFDGTLSLIRQGWPEVMVPMFVEMLPRLAGETDADLRRLAYDDIMRLNGKQTIYPDDPAGRADSPTRRQPAGAAVVQARVPPPARPADRRPHRGAAERHASGPTNCWSTAAGQLLERLSARGLTLYLASGTDEPCVKAEAELLDVARYFGPRIYGALDDYQSFSKQMVIDRILPENAISGERLLAFGDGYVEIENTKGVGRAGRGRGQRRGPQRLRPHGPWKRQRLLGVGADVVIPDYRDAEALL